MIWSLKDVASYVEKGTAPRPLLAILRGVLRVFDFEQERKNRLARFPKVVEQYKAGVPIRVIPDLRLSLTTAALAANRLRLLTVAFMPPRLICWRLLNKERMPSN